MLPSTSYLKPEVALWKERVTRLAARQLPGQGAGDDMQAVHPREGSIPVGADSASSGPRWRLLAAFAGGRWALYAVYFSTSWIITRLYWQITIQLDAATIDRFVGGTAEAPFAYRVLMPWVLRGVSRVNGIEDPALADMGVRILVLLGLMLLLRRWMRHFVGPLLSDVSPLLLALLLPGTFLWYWPYDFAALLVWTACLLALVERRYLLYLVVFVVGSLNRETTAFLIGVFVATQWQALGARRTLRWTAAQGAIFLAIYAGLRLAIHPVGGELVEGHLTENFRFLAGGNLLGPFENWMLMLSAMGFFWLLAPWYWSKKSVFLRQACWVIPLYAAAILVAGRLGEPRLWNVWTPIVLALAGQTLTEFARRDRELAGSEQAV